MFTTNQPAFKPVSRAERISSLDIIRGIALLGILLMNITGFGLPYSYSDPTVVGTATDLNIKAWAITNIFFEGTMRGLFSMLFGAGIILLTSRLEKSGAALATADIYYRRIIWLFIFGLIHMYILLWDGEILYPYAICGLFLFTFRNTSPKKLIISGLIILFLGSMWSLSDYHKNKTLSQEVSKLEVLKENGQELTKEETKKIEKWNEEIKEKTPEEIQEKIDHKLEGYWSNVEYNVKSAHFMQTWVMYRYFFYDIIGFMLLGMGLYKLKIFHASKSSKFYSIMAIVGYVIGLAINYYETKLLISTNFDVLTTYKSSLTYDVGRVAMTFGHIGLIMLFVKLPILNFLKKSLSAVGRMALTNYLMHSIICMFLFFGFGFGLYGQLERYELYYVVLSIWIFQLILSPIWLTYFKYGPFEWLWRSLTYKKWQSFKK